ncbi:MAG TPA: GNAT family N-acetyltransferase, partial [Chloroflexota bacterium]|nr:GNAT family N-acetyltransferase [Chloroflexota bacterium]
ELTRALEAEGGNVGYIIRPSQRRKGYGTLILALTLSEARRRGMSRVCVTIDADNLPSARVIEKNAGGLSGQSVSQDSGKLVSQYWIEFSSQEP